LPNAQNLMLTQQLQLFDDDPRKIPDRIGPARVTEVETLSLLSPGKGKMSWYDFALNPYRGCSFGCSYCYAQAYVADEEMKADWGKWVEVKIRAVEALRKKDLRDKRIFMSSATDPYQPLEKKIELTREIVTELARQEARLVVQTRSPIAARDADLFRLFKHIRVNMSVTTDDDAVRKRYEPGCASIDRRLEAVEALIAAGLRVAVAVCPMLPMRDPEAFGRRLSKLGVVSVYGGYFHETTRPFTANTRDHALVLAREDGWNEKAFEETYAALKRGCSFPETREEAFGPV